MTRRRRVGESRRAHSDRVNDRLIAATQTSWTASSPPRPAGTAIAAQKTDARITCLGAFMLDGKVSDATNDATDALADADLEDGPAEEDSDDGDSE